MTINRHFGIGKRFGLGWLTASKSNDDKHIEFTGSVEVQAADEGDDKSLPKFRINAYNGGPMQVGAFFSPVILDVRGVKAARKRIPILFGHDGGRPVGQSNEIAIAASGITIDGKMTTTQGDAAQIAEHAKNGFEWQASVGGNVTRREFLEAGKKASVNGREVTGPMIIAREFTLVETSILAIGADQSTQVKVAAKQTGDDDMKFHEWLKANGFDPDTLTDAGRKILQAQYEAEQTGDRGTATATTSEPAGDNKPITAGDGKVTDDLSKYRQKLVAERNRVAKIDEICGDKHVQIAAKAIEEEWSIEKTELEVLRAARPQVQTKRSEGDQQLHGEVLEASLCLSAGMNEEFVAKGVAQDRREQVMNQAVSAGYRGCGIHMLMDQVIVAAGMHYSGSRRDNKFIETALQAEQKLQASGFSTVTLSGHLGNTANKLMVSAFLAVNTVWQMICGVRPLNDFKTHTIYRLDATGAYKKVGQDGELKHIELGEGSHTLKADTFGAMVALTRQQMINDDLGAFAQLPNILGRLGALRLEEAVFALLLSNPGSFFSAGNKNLNTGAGSALSISSMTTAKQSFLDMVDSNNKPVLLNPRVLLVGTALKDTADVLLTERTIIDGTSTSKQPRKNPHVDSDMRLAVSGYMNNTNIKDQDGEAITGQSATKWLLFADPAVRAAINVGFLNGRRIPTIESAQTDFNTLGMQWRSFHDFGVGMAEEVAAVQNDGQ